MYSIKIEDTISYIYYADEIEGIIEYVLKHGICPSITMYDDGVEIGSVTEYLQP